MLYEIPLLGWGLVGHVLVVRRVPELQALPVAVQVGLVALPTALMAADLFHLGERLPPRAAEALRVLAGTLHLGLSLALPAWLALGVARGVAPVTKVLLSVPGLLLLLLPPVLFAGAYLRAALASWRTAPPAAGSR